jgi:hypothetical protein
VGDSLEVVAICFIGSIVSFAGFYKLQRFRVVGAPLASRANLSIEQRQQKIRMASWLSFAVGCVFLLAGCGFAYTMRG